MQVIDPELYHELWKQEHAELMSKVLAATRRARLPPWYPVYTSRLGATQTVPGEEPTGVILGQARRI